MVYNKTLREEIEEALEELRKNADVSMSHPGYAMANDKLAQWARCYGERFCLKLLDVVRLLEGERAALDGVDDADAPEESAAYEGDLGDVDGG